MTSEISLNAMVPVEKAGSRLDQVAADLFPDYSRSRIQQWIKDGELTLDGTHAKPNARLVGGEQLHLRTALVAEGDWQAQNIELDVIHEDEAILVINKPAGLVVHPAAGNWDGTLLNGLLYRFPDLENVPRAGIVHRLDKDTSGLMVVARTLAAQANLVEQLQQRSVSRVYHAIVHFAPDPSGKIIAAIGRHPTLRTKMAVLSSSGKPAITHFQRLENFERFSHVQLKLETGRTHQIRVHMAHIGHPLVGDPVYGKPIPAPELARNEQLAPCAEFPRQALHARELGLIHPVSSDYIEWQVDLPEDISELLQHLRMEFGRDE